MYFVCSGGVLSFAVHAECSGKALNKSSEEFCAFDVMCFGESYNDVKLFFFEVRADVCVGVKGFGSTVQDEVLRA